MRDTFARETFRVSKTTPTDWCRENGRVSLRLDDPNLTVNMTEHKFEIFLHEMRQVKSMMDAAE